jgi:hypothetical protein
MTREQNNIFLTKYNHIQPINSLGPVINMKVVAGFYIKLLIYMGIILSERILLIMCKRMDSWPLILDRSHSLTR